MYEKCIIAQMVVRFTGLKLIGEIFFDPRLLLSTNRTVVSCTSYIESEGESIPLYF